MQPKWIKIMDEILGTNERCSSSLRNRVLKKLNLLDNFTRLGGGELKSREVVALMTLLVMMDEDLGYGIKLKSPKARMGIVDIAIVDDVDIVNTSPFELVNRIEELEKLQHRVNQVLANRRRSLVEIAAVDDAFIETKSTSELLKRSEELEKLQKRIQKVLFKRIK